jgi:hypothetical protein
MTTSLERRLRKLEAADPANVISLRELTDEELFAVLREEDPGPETETFIRWCQTGEAPPDHHPMQYGGERDPLVARMSDAQLTKLIRAARRDGCK